MMGTPSGKSNARTRSCKPALARRRTRLPIQARSASKCVPLRRFSGHTRLCFVLVCARIPIQARSASKCVPLCPCSGPTRLRFVLVCSGHTRLRFVLVSRRRAHRKTTVETETARQRSYRRNKSLPPIVSIRSGNTRGWGDFSPLHSSPGGRGVDSSSCVCRLCWHCRRRGVMMRVPSGKFIGWAGSCKPVHPVLILAEGVSL